MPWPSKLAKYKVASITNAHQSCHTPQASGLLVPDPKKKEASPIMPKGLRCSSSPGFVIINNPYSGDISDGMTVQATIDSHLEMEGDWARIDQESNDQEEDEWDEQGHVMEEEELDDIYKDDELEELEGEELKAGLKLVMENQ